MFIFIYDYDSVPIPMLHALKASDEHYDFPIPTNLNTIINNHLIPSFSLLTHKVSCILSNSFLSLSVTMGGKGGGGGGGGESFGDGVEECGAKSCGGNEGSCLLDGILIITNKVIG